MIVFAYESLECASTIIDKLVIIKCLWRSHREKKKKKKKRLDIKYGRVVHSRIVGAERANHLMVMRVWKQPQQEQSIETLLTVQSTFLKKNNTEYY